MPDKPQDPRRPLTTREVVDRLTDQPRQTVIATTAGDHFGILFDIVGVFETATGPVLELAAKPRPTVEAADALDNGQTRIRWSNDREVHYTPWDSSDEALLARQLAAIVAG